MECVRLTVCVCVRACFCAESIINPEAPLALRLSGQLMLGVVRIYSRKVNYLFQDCSEALVKIKQVFRPGTVDLPADGAMAPDATITLPDNFDDLEFFFDPSPNAYGAKDGRGSVSRENITLADPDVDDFDAQFEYNEHLPVDDERLEDDVEVEVFRSAVVEAGVQLEDYDYVHDDNQAGATAEDDDLYDNDTFGPSMDIIPMPFDDDDVENDYDDMPRKSVGGDSLFGGALPLPSIPGSSLMGDRPDDGAQPGPARKRRKVERVIVFDRAVTLSNDAIRSQLKDTSDIVHQRAELEDDGMLSDPETLEINLRGRLMDCDVGSKLNEAYRKASAACWGREEAEREQTRREADAPGVPFTMNFDYADAGAQYDDGNDFGAADDFNLVDEDGRDAEQEDGDMEWNVNSKLMLEHLTGAFASSGDKPLSLKQLTAGKKRGEAARMFYQVLVLNAHEYLTVAQATAYGDVSMKKGPAFEA